MKQMGVPKYSILIPVYNVEKYVAECLDSVTNQTWNDFEAIIIDDGSTDSSGEICDEYAKQDARIRVYHQKNQGLMMSRKAAILYAKGVYCLFLDSDDYYDRVLLQEVDNYIMDNSVDLLLFNKKITYMNKEYEIPLIKEPFILINRNAMIREFVGTYKYNSVVNKVVRRDIILPYLDKIYISVNHAEDMLQTINFILLADNIGILNKSLYHYRMRAGSLVHQLSMNDVTQVLETENIVRELILSNSDLSAEELIPFYNNTTNNFMDCVYRLNNRKGVSNAEHIRQMQELYNNEKVKGLLTHFQIEKLAVYNRLRIVFFRKKYFRSLLLMDKMIIIIQKGMEVLKRKRKYE